MKQRVLLLLILLLVLTPGLWAQTGLDFRSTLGFVSDPAGQNFAANTDQFPKIYANGLKSGWEPNLSTCPNGPNNADRLSTNDPRLAGLETTGNNNVQNQCTLRFDLPAGTYTLNMAFGDPSNSLISNIVLLDNGVPFKTYTNVGIPQGSTTPVANEGFYMDATGIACTAAHFFTVATCNNPLVHTFSTPCGGATGCGFEIVMGQNPVYVRADATHTPQANTGLSEAGSTVTVTSTLNPGASACVNVSGATPAGYNGNWNVVTSSGTQYTFVSNVSGLGAGTVNGTTQILQCSPASTAIAFVTITPGGNVPPNVTPANPAVLSQQSITLTTDVPSTFTCPTCNGTLSNATPTSVVYTAPLQEPCQYVGGISILPCDAWPNVRIDSLPRHPNAGITPQTVSATCLGTTGGGACATFGAANTAVYTIGSTTGMTAGDPVTVDGSNNPNANIFNIDGGNNAVIAAVNDGTHFSVSITHADVASAADTGTVVTKWTAVLGRVAATFQYRAKINHVETAPTQAENSRSQYTPHDSFYTGLNYPFAQFPNAVSENGWCMTDGNNDRVRYDVNSLTGQIYNYYKTVNVNLGGPCGAAFSDSCGLSTAAANCNTASIVTFNGNSYFHGMGLSESASGLPFLPLSSHVNEVRNCELVIAQGGNCEIKHALQVALSNGRIGSCVTWPATVNAPQVSCTTPLKGIPYGTRIRLKSSFNISTFSPILQIFLRQLQHYGLVMTDGSPFTMSIGNTDTDRWAHNELTAIDLEFPNVGNIRGPNWEPVDASSLFICDYDVTLFGRCGRTTNSTEIVVATSNATGGVTNVPIVVSGVTIDADATFQWFQAGAPPKQIKIFSNSNAGFTCTMGVSIPGGTTVGSLTPGCLYTPPAILSGATQQFTITATSNADANAIVQITAAVFPNGDINILDGESQNTFIKSLTISGTTATLTAIADDVNRQTTWLWGAAGQTITISGYTAANDLFLNGTYTLASCCPSNIMTFTVPAGHSGYTATGNTGIVTNIYTDANGRIWTAGIGDSVNRHFDNGGFSCTNGKDTNLYRSQNSSGDDMYFNIWVPNGAYFATIKQAANALAINKENYEFQGIPYYVAQDTYTDNGNSHGCIDYYGPAVVVNNNQLLFVVRRNNAGGVGTSSGSNIASVIFHPYNIPAPINGKL